jgi:hypothetical protein
VLASIPGAATCLFPTSRDRTRAVSCRSMPGALTPAMTVRDFENGYWYTDQLKTFADALGIPSPKKLRKDELERAILRFLRTGDAALPTRRSLRKTGVKDLERGLSLKLLIANYTSNRETKDFIVRQAGLIAPDVRERSGVWYRLNRWREERMTADKRATRAEAIAAWKELKELAVPKDYPSWVTARARRSRP